MKDFNEAHKDEIVHEVLLILEERYGEEFEVVDIDYKGFLKPITLRSLKHPEFDISAFVYKGGLIRDNYQDFLMKEPLELEIQGL